jgi:hypothetical protein
LLSFDEAFRFFAIAAGIFNICPVWRYYLI